MFCSYCGKPLNDDAVFCSSCGKRLGAPGKGETAGGSAPRAGGPASPDAAAAPAAFDMMVFWRKNASSLLLLDGHTKLHRPEWWAVEFAPAIGPNHMRNALSAKGLTRGMIRTEDLLCLATYNPTKKPDGNNGGLIGYALCREGFGFQTMASPSDGMLFGIAGSAVKLAGKSVPYVRYRDILSVYAQDRYLVLKMASGETKELYMSTFFDGPSASRLFGEVLSNLR